MNFKPGCLWVSGHGPVNPQVAGDGVGDGVVAALDFTAGGWDFVLAHGFLRLVAGATNGHVLFEDGEEYDAAFGPGGSDDSGMVGTGLSALRVP